MRNTADHRGVAPDRGFYVIKADVRCEPPDERRQIRQSHSRLLFDDLERWLRVSLDTLSRKSNTATVILYALKLWPTLLRSCDDGAVEMITRRPNAS